MIETQLTNSTQRFDPIHAFYATRHIDAQVKPNGLSRNCILKKAPPFAANRNRTGKRDGAAVVVMVLVLGGIAISLLLLAGRTSIQMKAIQATAIETQQCNELIEFGEAILANRLAANPEFQSETIRLQIATSLTAHSDVAPWMGIIEIGTPETAEQAEKAEKSVDHVTTSWSINVYLGASERNLRQASKTVLMKSATRWRKQNE